MGIHGGGFPSRLSACSFDLFPVECYGSQRAIFNGIGDKPWKIVLTRSGHHFMLPEA